MTLGSQTSCLLLPKPLPDARGGLSLVTWSAFHFSNTRHDKPAVVVRGTQASRALSKCPAAAEKPRGRGPWSGLGPPRPGCRQTLPTASPARVRSGHRTRTPQPLRSGCSCRSAGPVPAFRSPPGAPPPWGTACTNGVWSLQCAPGPCAIRERHPPNRQMADPRAWAPGGPLPCGGLAGHRPPTSFP